MKEGGGGSRVAELFIWSLTWTAVYLLLRLPQMTMTTLLPKNTETEQGLMGNSSMALQVIKGNKISLNLEGPPRSIKQINKKSTTKSQTLNVKDIFHIGKLQWHRWISVFNIFTLGLSGALFVSYMLLSGSEWEHEETRRQKSLFFLLFFFTFDKMTSFIKWWYTVCYFWQSEIRNIIATWKTDYWERYVHPDC